jgi:hypothetical protein
MLSVAICNCLAECHCDECRYAEHHYAECRYSECRYAECCGAKKLNSDQNVAYLC